MFYSDDIVQEVISANDIVDLVSSYTQLKRSGRGFTGLCPFHNEKTPSFHVSPDKQLYHCFGCGVGGSAVQFVMAMENLDFTESLKFLADRASIPLPEPTSQSGFLDKNHKKKQQALAANKLAAKFFYETLIGENGKAGLGYFAGKRGFTKETIVRFGLGFAPDTKDALINHLVKHGYEKSDLVDFGLAIIKNNQYIDKFRNRVMFPIIDVRGNIIGFGGRVLDDSKPKYLNTSDTVAFNKSNNLFALNLAKSHIENTIILAEGYMDVIALFQAGVKNVVATLGTSLTDMQAKIISRYAGEVVICYDTDGAGITATLRAINIFQNTGLRVRVLSLPGAKDPDEFVKINGGSARFFELLKSAPGATEFRLNLLKKDYDIDNSTEEKITFITEAAKILLSTKNMVEIDAYAQKLSDDYGIEKKSFLLEVERLSSKNQKYDASRTGRKVVINNPSVPRSVNVTSGQEDKKEEKLSPRPTNKIINAEKKLLSLVYSSKAAAKRAKEEILWSDYSIDVHKKLANYCYSLWESDTQPNAGILLSEFSSDEANYVTDILMDHSVYDDVQTATEDLISSIKLERIESLLKTEKNPEVLLELLKTQKLLKSRKENT